MDKYQPYLEIDMNIVDNNIKLLAKDKKPCLMVKANQYHVLSNVKPLLDLGYDFFGVSTLEELETIHNLNQEIDVLVVTRVDVNTINNSNNKYTHYTITDIDDLKEVNDNVNIHLKFDTGMGRIGFTSSQVMEVINIIKTRNLNIKGIYTHFPCGSDKEYTTKQIKRFKEIVDRFTENDIYPTYIHCQNSIGCSLYDISWCNMVRPGIGIWGYGANKLEASLTNVKPSLTLKAPVSFIKEYHGLIGYDHIESVDGIIGTIKLGYNDGLDRRASGYQFKEGKIVGKVCMCQTMIKLASKDVREVTIFEQDDIYDLCNYIDYTVYELLTSLSFRIKRIIK